MDRYGISDEVINKLPSPCYLVDRRLLERNLEIIADVQKRSGCKILCALKGFSMFSVFDLIKRYLVGISASSLNEARLGFEQFGGQVHVVAPAYRDDEFEALVKYADHIVFNSFSQWERFRGRLEKSGKKVEAGLRINPQYSEIKVEIYNPCAKFSRLGIPLEHFKDRDLGGISGLHFHTMCEQNSDTLERTVEVVQEKFGRYIEKMKWVNFGGGHHITRPDYDIDKLCGVIKNFRERYDIELFLEPGEAIALNTGFLIATVLDIINNGMDIAILDTSAAAHMPDVLEMPYRPQIVGADLPNRKPCTYRLGGLTCLAGDVIGDYSFEKPLKIGDRLVFLDMAHYTMVKNNTFNGVSLPSIAVCDSRTGEFKVVRQFSYEDYKNRLS